MSGVTAEEMRQIEARAFSRGVEAGTLMDRAGERMAAWLIDHFPIAGRAMAFVGKGNNGGDALVVLEHLRRAGWSVGYRMSHPAWETSVLSRQRQRRLGLDPRDEVPSGSGPLVLLDGLLGIGASGALREPLASLAGDMAALREHRGGQLVAIDLPSGFDADGGGHGDVVADVTLTLGMPKAGMFADGAVDYCGRIGWVVLEDLTDFQAAREGTTLASPAIFSSWLPPRAHSAHKGDAGRVSILAGSPGMGGAGVLCSEACLRSGAGLVRLFQDPADPARAAAEVMAVQSGRRVPDWLESDANVLVAGPGLGPLDDASRAAFFDALAADARPMLLDADALNLIAAHERGDLLAARHVVTPHPGEFARLAPDLAGWPRIEAARAFVERYPCTLLLKGARTVVVSPERPVVLNPCGHAGMATGGQGDVLAGVIGGLLAGGGGAHEAAALGAWLCGRAAERAVTHGGESVESCLARDTVAHLGGAFHDWRSGCR